MPRKKVFTFARERAQVLVNSVTTIASRLWILKYKVIFFSFFFLILVVETICCWLLDKALSNYCLLIRFTRTSYSFVATERLSFIQYLFLGFYLRAVATETAGNKMNLFYHIFMLLLSQAWTGEILWPKSTHWQLHQTLAYLQYFIIHLYLFEFDVSERRRTAHFHSHSDWASIGSGSGHRLDETKVAHNHNATQQQNHQLFSTTAQLYMNAFVYPDNDCAMKTSFFCFSPFFSFECTTIRIPFGVQLNASQLWSVYVESYLGNDHNRQRQPLWCSNIAESIAYKQHSASISFKRI